MATTAEFLSSLQHIFKPCTSTSLSVSWNPPSSGWVKLNTDGSVKGSCRAAGAGGALRDCHGNWIAGFAKNLGTMNSFQAELWAVRQGLLLAIDLNHLFLEIDMDAKSVVDILSSNLNHSHTNANLVAHCRSLIQQLNGVKISHIYREANSVADQLAKYGADMSTEILLFDQPPVFVSSLVAKDVAGFCYFRNQ